MNQKLYIRDAQGEFVPAQGPAILAAAQIYLRNRVRRGASLQSPAAVREYLTVALGDRDCEYFCVILLDCRHRVLRYLEMFRGTIDGASVYPREVVKVALQERAAAILLVHNHPLCGIAVSPPHRWATQFGSTPLGVERALDGSTVQ